MVILGLCGGCISAAFAAIAIPHGFYLKSKEKSSAKIGEINVEQKGDRLSNVTGAEIGNPTIRAVYISMLCVPISFV